VAGTAITILNNRVVLMALAKLNALPLLKRLYGMVIISQKVYEEVVIEGLARGYSDVAVVELFWEQQRWSPMVVEPEEIPRELRGVRLDPEERESLYLASKSRETLLLVDDEVARAIARERGIQIKGTLGFLVEAFRKKLLPLEELEFLFAQIEKREDIWISPDLCRQVLAGVKKEEGMRSRRKNR
jgi:predicted nucleic acid-binding protein